MIVCLRKDVSDRRDTKTHTIYWEIFAPILILPPSPSLSSDEFKIVRNPKSKYFSFKKSFVWANS